MKPSPIASSYPPRHERFSSASRIVTADVLTQVHEPLKWKLQTGERVDPQVLASSVRRAFVGARACVDGPRFLRPHQQEAYKRIRATLNVYGGALLSDAVGLGKTFVGLAVARTFSRVLVVSPAAIAHQWRRAAASVGVFVHIVSHEALSRGRRVPSQCRLIVVDEAHRFRNAKTARYRNLSRCVMGADVLLITATPVVNGPRDLLHLLRLFLPDHGLAFHGIASLEDALRAGARHSVLMQVSSLIVARSAESAGIDKSVIPSSVDAPLDASPPMRPVALERVLAAIDALEFPAFGTQPEARRLLRTHLLYRLHSSVQAIATTVRRHRMYLRRALEAAQNGVPLSRRDVRRVFDMDDQQLDLDLLFVDSYLDHIDTTRFLIELRRLDELIEYLVRHGTTSPKLDSLSEYLDGRRSEKTVVFVNAIPTAKAIARRLAWSELLVVTSGKARISSGTLPLADALNLFAPRASGRSMAPDCLALNVLIATDVLSEGVNLQDANAIVHYDLPWTSLRLQQRLGRISRMDTAFQSVAVRWFVPPPAVERRLGLCQRIATKLQYQLGLGVAATSKVGRARVTNAALEKRELIIAATDGQPNSTPCFAVVEGPLAAVYAVQWTLSTGIVYDVIVTNRAGDVVIDLALACDMVIRLLASQPSKRAPDSSLQQTCEEAIRLRLAAAVRGPTNQQGWAIGKSIVARARDESRLRRFENLDLLDSVLQAVQNGLPIGAENQLREIMENDFRIAAVKRWLSDHQRRGVEVVDVRVDAALFGDGSVAQPRDGEVR